MHIQLPLLPYSLSALEPVISRKTLEHHYLKHHRSYIDKLNELISDTHYAKMSLDEIIFASANGSGTDRKIFNHAAQAWNHAFYWSSMSPNLEQPSTLVKDALKIAFGSTDEFLKRFVQAGKDLFGSGWVWLVRDASGKLLIVSKENAGNPLISGATPLLVVDVWEHAYYLDQQENRAAYLDQFPRLINWKFVEENLQVPHPFNTNRTSNSHSAYSPELR